MKDTALELMIPEGDALRPVEVRGETWYLRSDENQNPERVRKQLKSYVESIGGKMHHFDPSLAVFSVEENDTTIWWCKALIEFGLDLTIMKETRLLPGTPLIFKMGDGGRHDVRFYADNPGTRFRSITVTMPDGEITFTAELNAVSGAYRRRLAHKRYLPSIKSHRFVIDDIPQEAGKCLFSLSKDSGQTLCDVTVELTEYDYPVPKVAMGQQLGALRIKNIPYGIAKVLTQTPFGTMHSEHPEFPDGSGFEQGDVTPRRRCLLSPPPGTLAGGSKSPGKAEGPCPSRVSYSGSHRPGNPA